MDGHLRESSSASGTTGSGADRRPSNMKQLFTSRWPNKDGSAALPSSSQVEPPARTEEKDDQRRPPMEKEESLRLVDVNTCCSAESSTPDDQTEELTLKLRPQALGDNTMHNSSSLFSQKLLDAIQKDAEQGTNSISNFDCASTSATDGPFQVKGLFFATVQGTKAESNSKKRRVTFNRSILCRPHINRDQITDEEKYAYWRNDADKYATQQETLATARKMRKLYAEWVASDDHDANLTDFPPIEEQPWYIDDDDATSRGIEQMRTKAHTRARKEQKRHIVDAVLYEQFVQRRCGMNDSGLLAMTSSEISNHCREWADQKARGDAIHGEKRRESLLARCGPAAKGMNIHDAQLLVGLKDYVHKDEEAAEEEEDRGSQLTPGENMDDDDEKQRRRSSAISFERHDAVIAEELNALVDDEGNSTDQKSNQTNNKEEASVISKFELCTLDEQVASGLLQMRSNTDVDTVAPHHLQARTMAISQS